MLVTAGVQIAMPSSAALPENTVVAPRTAPDAPEPTAGTYTAVLARPIFAPDRAPVLLQAQTAAGSLSGYQVIGTAVAGPISAALVRDAAGRIVRVKPEALLQGWRVVSIDRTQMILDREGERRSLTVTAAPAHASGINPELSSAQKKSADDDDDSDDSSNKSDSDDDDDD